MLCNRVFSWSVALRAICLCLALALAACATQTAPPAPTGSSTASLVAPQPPAITETPRPPKMVKERRHGATSKTVKASYQGNDTAGRRTASGEPYDPNDLTAASRNLRLGSTVKVTNPDTGRSVKVRINDRGPVVRGRNLDLSRSAAEKIGITEKGVARVKVTRVSSHMVAHDHELPSPAPTPVSPDNLRPGVN